MKKSSLYFIERKGRGACENPMFNGSMKMKEMIFCGELSLLLPECIDWRGESQECIVDEEALLQLFGNKNATGQMIEPGGKKYTICLTIKGEEGVVIRKAETESCCNMYQQGGKQGENREAIQKLTMILWIAGEEISCRCFIVSPVRFWLNSGCLWCLGSSSAVKYMEGGEQR